MLKKKCTNIIIQSVLIEIHAGKKGILKISFLSYKNVVHLLFKELNFIKK